MMKLRWCRRCYQRQGCHFDYKNYDYRDSYIVFEVEYLWNGLVKKDKVST